MENPGRHKAPPKEGFLFLRCRSGRWVADCLEQMFYCDTWMLERTFYCPFYIDVLGQKPEKCSTSECVCVCSCNSICVETCLSLESERRLLGKWGILAFLHPFKDTKCRYSALYIFHTYLLTVLIISNVSNNVQMQRNPQVSRKQWVSFGHLLLPPGLGSQNKIRTPGVFYSKKSDPAPVLFWWKVRLELGLGLKLVWGLGYARHVNDSTIHWPFKVFVPFSPHLLLL